jgi:kynurenine formamidase
MTLFDLTHPLGPLTPIYPADEPVRVRVVSDCAAGDVYTSRRLDLSTHSGTQPVITFDVINPGRYLHAP